MMDALDLFGSCDDDDEEKRPNIEFEVGYNIIFLTENSNLF